MYYPIAGALVPISIEDYKAGHNAGADAANRSMRDDKRKKWNKKDFGLAADTMDKVIFNLVKNKGNDNV